MLIATDTVEPLPGDSLLLFLLQIGTLLTLALCLGRLGQRIGLPSIVGELATGVLLGPSVLAHLAPAISAWLFPREADRMHLLDGVGQLGVLLLVGFTGMHVDVKLARRHGKTAASVSAAALVFPLGLGLALGLAFPPELKPSGIDPMVFASFLGVAMCVSSIPIIGRVLVDMGLIHRTIGQMILVVATIDDAVGWLLVSVVTAMATTGLGGHEVLTPLCHMAALLLLTLTVGRWAVRRIMRWAARSGSPGSTVTVVVALLMLAGAGAQALGFEALLGAFLCGLLIGSGESGQQAQRLEPLNTTVLAFLSPLFFALAGLRIDLTSLAHTTTALWALAALAVAVASKFLGAFVGSAIGGLSRWEALAVGAGINARGVIQVVIAVVGVRLGLLNTATYGIIVLIAIITPLMAPPVLKAAVKRVDHTKEEQLREQRGCTPVPHGAGW